MKRTFLLLVIAALFHLIVIDLIYYLVSTTSAGFTNMTAVIGYNLLWLFIAGSMWFQGYNESSNN